MITEREMVYRLFGVKQKATMRVKPAYHRVMCTYKSEGSDKLKYFEKKYYTISALDSEMRCRKEIKEKGWIFWALIENTFVPVE